MKLALPLMCACIALTLATAGYSATQQEMNQAAGRQYEQADQALNQAYARLMARLDASRQEKLKLAQRAWLRFRDAQAELVSSAWEGGSIRPLIHGEELTRLTEHRTAELLRLLEEGE
ncbi:lysozyme inhibitor LprI family protein [Zobellella sp. DQSA1]|uniref:lysozyme inhibitor LprI family protein n=1 Tax=Zobellella sp. DQSA1 TaxID=3342386 RepID=UPI0035C25CCD